jgi:hypothetical protein
MTDESADKQAADAARLGVTKADIYLQIRCCDHGLVC